jgi:hypothetical protein
MEGHHGKKLYTLMLQENFSHCSGRDKDEVLREKVKKRQNFKRSKIQPRDSRT